MQELYLENNNRNLNLSDSPETIDPDEKGTPPLQSHLESAALFMFTLKSKMLLSSPLKKDDRSLGGAKPDQLKLLDYYQQRQLKLLDYYQQRQLINLLRMTIQCYEARLKKLERFEDEYDRGYENERSLLRVVKAGVYTGIILASIGIVSKLCNPITGTPVDVAMHCMEYNGTEQAGDHYDDLSQFKVSMMPTTITLLFCVVLSIGFYYMLGDYRMPDKKELCLRDLREDQREEIRGLLSVISSAKAILDKTSVSDLKQLIEKSLRDLREDQREEIRGLLSVEKMFGNIDRRSVSGLKRLIEETLNTLRADLSSVEINLIEETLNTLRADLRANLSISSSGMRHRFFTSRELQQHGFSEEKRGQEIQIEGLEYASNVSTFAGP